LFFLAVVRVQKHQASLAILKKRKPAKITVSLGRVLLVGGCGFLYFATAAQWRRLRRVPNDAIAAIGVGMIVGLLYRRYMEKYKCGPRTRAL
jgi:hypothetical protein